MPELLVMRHAKSDWRDSSLSDFDRPLNDRGRRCAPAMGEVIGTIGPVDRILASPARRVVETLEGVRKTVLDLPPADFEKSLYGASVPEIVNVLRERGEDAKRVLLMGHNPSLHWLALGLTEGDDHPDRGALAHKYPTAALAHIEFDGFWGTLGEGQGRLLAFVKPKDL